MHSICYQVEATAPEEVHPRSGEPTFYLDSDFGIRNGLIGDTVSASLFLYIVSISTDEFVVYIRLHKIDNPSGLRPSWYTPLENKK